MKTLLDFLTKKEKREKTLQTTTTSTTTTSNLLLTKTTSFTFDDDSDFEDQPEPQNSSYKEQLENRLRCFARQKTFNKLDFVKRDVDLIVRFFRDLGLLQERLRCSLGHRFETHTFVTRFEYAWSSSLSGRDS